MIGYYLTHPQVAINPDIAVPLWSLSDRGRQRMSDALSRPWWQTIHRIVTSDETKAVETATLVAEAIGVKPVTWPDMGENDRSSTGFLPPERFEAAADAFFANPSTSWRGWETATDAQTRIVAAANSALDANGGAGPILFVGHGAVGTLLKCSLAGVPIDRSHDQPGGGGNIYAFSLDERRLLCDWTPIETFEGVDHG